MEFNWEDFKNGKIAVHCKTEEEAKEFIKQCYKHGMKWCYSNENITHWDDVSEKNYYTYDICGKHICYGNLDWKSDILIVVNYKEDNKMELKEGMIIECRNGTRYLLRTVCGELIASSNGKYMGLDYDEKLNENQYFDKDFDIMKVYTSKAFVLNSLFDDQYLECIWERKEPKKMTLAQISEALGYEVEVADNE